MMTVTTAEAQDNLIDLMKQAQIEPVSILHEGQPSAYLISADEMDEMRDIRRRQDAAAAFEAWTILAHKHKTPAADELTEEDIVRMVHEER